MARTARRGRSIIGPTRRAEFGATVTLVDMATGDDACIAYTGVGSVAACRLAADECDRRGPSWRVRCVSTPDTIYRDVTGERAAQPETILMGLAGRADLCEFIPSQHGLRASETKAERLWRP